MLTPLSLLSLPLLKTGDVMIMLNRLFTLFDECCEYHNVFKVETIGDSYMCVSGLNTNGDGDRERQAEMNADDLEGRVRVRVRVRVGVRVRV